MPLVRIILYNLTSKVNHFLLLHGMMMVGCPGTGRQRGKKLWQVRQVQLSLVLHLPASALNTIGIRKNSENTI